MSTTNAEHEGISGQEAEKEGSDENEPYKEFLMEYFNESSILRTSKTQYINSAMYEYMASRTMNSNGQPLKLEGEKDEGEEVTVRLITPDTTPIDEYISKVSAANNVEIYTKLAEFNAEWASNADMGRELSCRGEYEEDRPETETLRKRALVYSGVGGALFVVFLSFAAGLYSFQSIRLANIAFSLAFIGLLLFVTLTGIAFVTVFDIGKANYKEASHRMVVAGEGE